MKIRSILISLFVGLFAVYSWFKFPSDVDYNRYQLTDYFNDLRLQKEPVIGKTAAEILKDWGRPECIEVEGQRSSYFADGLIKTVSVEDQLKSMTIQNQTWGYHSHRFTLKKGRCVEVYKAAAWW